MRNKDQYDTIAAIATPTGSGGIGIIRISGPKALDILNRTFIPHRKSKPKPYLLRYGRITGFDDKEILDEVLSVYMPGPKSFTGEDLVEIYCHAGQISLRTILDNILKLYCRPAEPGEFSLRRFLNHGVDLTKLEGAAELVSSKTDLAYRLSREHLIGAYGNHISELRKKIVHLLAEIEADLDFPEEESVGRIGREMLDKQLDKIITDLVKLAEGYKTGKIIKDGYRVIVWGPPNAGKSSLFNRLVRQNRALVTPIAGTTRDYLSEWIDLEGLPIKLYDTAGMRAGRGRVEKAGIESSRKLIGRADLIIYIFDLTSRPAKIENTIMKQNIPLIVVLNKADLLRDGRKKIDKWRSVLSDTKDVCIISAKTGRGIKDLIKEILMKAGTVDLTESLIVTSHRHKTKIDRTISHLRRIRKMARLPSDIVSLELREAADQIGEITGHIYTEEILDEIFSSFCIGK